MQIICTSLQTDNHAIASPLSFYRPDAHPVVQPTASKHWRHQALKVSLIGSDIWLIESHRFRSSWYLSKLPSMSFTYCKPFRMRFFRTVVQNCNWLWASRGPSATAELHVNHIIVRCIGSRLSSVYCLSSPETTVNQLLTTHDANAILILESEFWTT